MIVHKHKFFHQKKNDPMNHRKKAVYNIFRNRVNREIKKAKKKYYQNYFETNLNNMKKTWKGIKEIININNNTGPQISQLLYEDRQINSNEGMANAFNDFFTNVGPKLDEKIPKKPRDPKVYLKSKITSSFIISPTSPHEICEIIGNLDDSKSSGPCSIPTKFLKLVRNEISVPFSDICNSSFTEGTFPDKAKIVKLLHVRRMGL